jgi:hypothetical protein
MNMWPVMWFDGGHYSACKMNLWRWSEYVAIIMNAQ